MANNIIKRVHIKSEHQGLAIPFDGEHPMDHWKVKLSFQRRQYTFDFYKGLGLHGTEPGKKEVLHSLVIDAQCGDVSFEEFCGEFGYDTDSRKAEATWKACKKAAKHIKRLLGEHFEEITEIVREY